MKKGKVTVFFVIIFVIIFTISPKAKYYNNVDTDNSYDGSGYLVIVNTGPELITGYAEQATGALPTIKEEAIDFLFDIPSFNTDSIPHIDEQLMGYDEEGNGLIDPNTFVDNEEIIVESPFLDNSKFKSYFQMKTINEKSLSSNYSINSTKQLLVDLDRDEPGKLRYTTFKCIAISEYSTVWVPTNADYVPISTADANLLAAEFDSRYVEMMDAYGQVLGDAELTARTGIDVSDPDNDGKVAIVCYDIENDNELGYNSYYGGYFYSLDLWTGFIQDSIPYNATDMIHIDSAQGMANGVEQSYSTLFHELQHLISFMELGQYGIELPIFLEEAFSESTTHLLYGDEENISRINYFNNNDNVDSISLTVWEGSLYNYSLSYMFSQYLRTQYSGGETVYKDFYQHLQRFYLDEILGDEFTGGALPTMSQYVTYPMVFVDFLETDNQNFDIYTYTNNFYIALAAKEMSGPFGFYGEEFAYNISPRITTPTTWQLMLKGGEAIYLDIENLEGFVPATTKGPRIEYTLASFNPEKTSISGTVAPDSNSNENYANISLQFYDESIGEYRVIREQIMNTDEISFMMDKIPKSDDYRLVVSINKHVDTTIEGLDLLNSSNNTRVTMGSEEIITLPYGDVNGDGNVDFSDLDLIRSASNYNKTTELSDIGANGDLNNDGMINFSELDLIRSADNYNKYSINNIYNLN